MKLDFASFAVEKRINRKARKGLRKGRKERAAFTESVTSVRESTERFPGSRHGLCERGASFAVKCFNRKGHKEKEEPRSILTHLLVVVFVGKIG